MNKLLIILSVFIVTISCNRDKPLVSHQDFNCSDNNGILFNLDSLGFYKKCVDLLILDDDTISGISQRLSSLPKLYEIKFTKCYFSDLGDLFFNLSKSRSLKKLTIDIPSQTSIPKEIGLLQNLEELIITIDSSNSLPEEFYSLKGLKTLYVFANYYEENNQFSNFINLESLGISANIKNVPPFIFGLRNLNKLDLSNNPIEIIPEKIAQLKLLKEINILNTPFIKSDMNRLKKGQPLKDVIKLKEDCHGCKVISNITSFR